jgi:hypothetical protein
VGGRKEQIFYVLYTIYMAPEDFDTLILVETQPKERREKDATPENPYHDGCRLRSRNMPCKKNVTLHTWTGTGTGCRQLGRLQDAGEEMVGRMASKSQILILILIFYDRLLFRKRRGKRKRRDLTPSTISSTALSTS